jgi:hypothetical protein
MRKGLALTLLATFMVVAFAGIVVADSHMKTIDQPAEKWPAKKLKEGAKKKPPVTFDHKAHGEMAEGCGVCHHKADQAALDAGNVKSCFECHGPEADGEKVDTYKMIHDKKAGKCLKCHTEKGGNAPTKCKDCHKE